MKHFARITVLGLFTSLFSTMSSADSCGDVLLLTRTNFQDLTTLSEKYAYDTLVQEASRGMTGSGRSAFIGSLVGYSEWASAIKEGNSSATTSLRYSLNYARQVVMSRTPNKAIEAWLTCMQDEAGKPGLFGVAKPLPRGETETVLAVTWRDGAAPRKLTLHAPLLPEGVSFVDPPASEVDGTVFQPNQTRRFILKVDKKAIRTGNSFNLLGFVGSKPSSDTEVIGDIVSLHRIKQAPLIRATGAPLTATDKWDNCKHHANGQSVSATVVYAGDEEPYLKGEHVANLPNGPLTWGYAHQLETIWLLEKNDVHSFVDLVVGESSVRIAEHKGGCEGSHGEFYLKKGSTLTVIKSPDPD